MEQLRAEVNSTHLKASPLFYINQPHFCMASPLQKQQTNTKHTYTHRSTLKMSSKGEGSSSTSERKVKKEIASVIPVKRKLVKTMAVEAIVSAFSPSAISRPTGDGNGKGNGGRVYPTRP